MNFIASKVAELTGGGTITAAVAAGGVQPGDAVTVGVRPEHVRILPTGPAPLSAAIQLIENLGDHAILHLDREQHDGGRVLAKVDRAPAAEGATVGFELPAAECHVFDAQGLALPRRG